MSLPEGFVRPDYRSSFSLYGLSCGLAKFFNVKRDCAAEPLELQGRRLVLIYLDALNWTLFTEANIRLSGSVTKGVTVFPSTTAAALATLMTAQTPGEHGLIGYQVYNKILGGVVNMIKYSYAGEQGSGTISSSRPLAQAFPISPWLRETEARVLAIMPHTASSGELTRTFLQDRPSPELTTIRSFSGPYEMLAAMEEALEGDPYDMIYVYYDNPDHIGHGYGFSSPRRHLIVDELHSLLSHIDSMASKYKDKYTFVLMSDHGQVTVSKVFVFNEDAELMNMLEVPPYGDSRAVWLRSRADVRKYLEEKYNMVVFTTDEVEELGLLGRLNDFVRRNIMGDYLGIARNPDTKYVYAYRDNDPSLRLKGNHSGLTSEEMHVPIVLWS